MKILMIGPPGAGKGIQSELLAKNLRIKHISVGDVLREMAKKKDKVGKTLKEHMAKGILIPDDLNDRIIQGLLTRQKGNYIMDGYPRNLHQAGYLLRVSKPDMAISINISGKECIRRIMKRRMCTANHKTFIVDEITSKERKECRVSGGKIVRRPDDTPKVIKGRLVLFHKNTLPLIDFLKKKKVKVIEINGEQPIDRVARDILRKAKQSS